MKRLIGKAMRILEALINRIIQKKFKCWKIELEGEYVEECETKKIVCFISPRAT